MSMLMFENEEGYSIAKDLAVQEETFIREALGIKEDELLIIPLDLTKYTFDCPICKGKKSATELVRVEYPLKMVHEVEGDKLVVTVSEKVMLACRECVNKITVSEKGLKV